MKIPVQISGALRVEYRVQLRSMAGETSLITNENRVVGGNGGAAALALAQLNVPVTLQCNAVGDDAHGRFLLAQLNNAPLVEHELELRPGLLTPYAILMRDENGTKTLLSPEAARLEGNQDYAALLVALRLALCGQSDQTQVERWVAAYDEGFGDFSCLDAPTEANRSHARDV